MPKKPKGGRRNYDWTALTHEYVTDPNMSLRKLAKKYGIGYDTIAKKSKAEGWFATRKEFQSKLVSKCISETADLQAKLIALESEYLNMLMDHLGEILADKDQFHRHIVTNTQGMDVTTTEEIFSKADTRAMKDSFQMIKMFDDISVRINNIERIENIRKHDIDAARLQLEREKFEFEKQKAEYTKPDSSIVIRTEGFEESWAE